MMRDTPERTPHAEEPQDTPSQNNERDPEQQWLDDRPAEKPIDEHPTEEDQVEEQEEPSTIMTVETPEKADNEETKEDQLNYPDLDTPDQPPSRVSEIESQSPLTPAQIDTPIPRTQEFEVTKFKIKKMPMLVKKVPNRGCDF